MEAGGPAAVICNHLGLLSHCPFPKGPHQPCQGPVFFGPRSLPQPSKDASEKRKEPNQTQRPSFCSSQRTRRRKHSRVKFAQDPRSLRKQDSFSFPKLHSSNKSPFQALPDASPSAQLVRHTETQKSLPFKPVAGCGGQGRRKDLSPTLSLGVITSRKPSYGGIIGDKSPMEELGLQEEGRRGWALEVAAPKVGSERGIALHRQGLKEE